jgi:two-component system OmpR family sensor kinase
MDSRQNLLLTTLELLLAIDSTDVQSALSQAAQLIGEALYAEKVDVFIYHLADHTLVALGTSDTPMSQHEKALGLDQLPIANRGRIAEVFLTGISFLTGHANEDSEQLIGFINPAPDGLGILSEIITPIEVSSERRGVIVASSSKPDFFTEQDLHFLEATARWVGIIMHRAELLERETREAREQGRRMAAEELVTVLAHDLRNYLTPIKARIDLMARRAQREKREPDIRDTAAASSAMSNLDHLIGDLLDVARLEQGIFGIHPQPVSLVNLIQELIPLFSTPDCEIHLYAPQDIELEADPERIRQALENLLANAIKYAPKKTPVDVKVEVQSQEEGSWVRITISNQGPGIPTNILPHLFQPFVAGSTSTGLGLGLYLASQIAIAHGGNLNVESPPGHGVHFILSLPIDSEYQVS